MLSVLDLVIGGISVLQILKIEANVHCDMEIGINSTGFAGINPESLNTFVKTKSSLS